MSLKTNLSLKEKIGQLFMCGFEGTTPSNEIVDLIQNYYIGGVIYFSRNITNTKQVFQLSNSLQELSLKSTSIPLTVSIDQEGGMVARIIHDVTLSPGNMALGSTRNIDYTKKLASIVGEELRLLGINMNFAPCIDVNNNPKNPVIGVRSYGENPQLVSEFGIAAVEGYQNSNISAVVKHFPGHGDTNVDSHLGLPIIPHSIDRLVHLELMPFQQTIQQNVDAVMVAHVAFPAIDEAIVPSTLSETIVTDLLRKKLNYNGVVMTDCMEMKAIIDHYGIEEAAILAIEAGNDLVLVSHTYERQKAAIEAVEKAVENGRISIDRINESVDRLLKLKSKRELATWEKDWNLAKSKIAKEEHVSLAREVSEKSITIVKDDLGILPLKNKKTLVIWPEVNVTTEVDETINQNVTLGGELVHKLSFVKEVVIQLIVDDQKIKELCNESSQFEQVIICTYNANETNNQGKLVQQLVEKSCAKVIAVALRSPYDLRYYNCVKTYLTIYESRDLAVQSLAKTLLGEGQPTGLLPIRINDQFSLGWKKE